MYPKTHNGMASTLSDSSGRSEPNIQSADVTGDCDDLNCDLSSLSNLISSLTLDPSTGDEGFKQAMRSLLSALYRACESDDVSLFKTILSCIGSAEMFPDMEGELLRSAIMNGSFKCARHLAEIVADVSLCSVLSWMCVRSWDELTFQTLLARGFKVETCACKGMGVLKHCIINGNDELVEVCLQNGCSPDALSVELPPDDDHTPQVAVEEFSPLMCAILYANSAIVGKLLEYGADVYGEEICGMSPLEASVYASKPTETSLILSRYQESCNGSDSNNTDRFKVDVQKAFINALSMAPSQSLTECMTALMHCGANVHSPDDDGCLPLLVAIDAKHLKTVRFLLQNGCDVNTVGNVLTIGSDEGFRKVSPLTLAADQSDDRILSLLVKAGAVAQSDENVAESSKKRITQCRKQLSLSDWCRVCIRQQLTISPVETVVEDWEIPSTLKRFLSMS